MNIINSILQNQELVQALMAVLVALLGWLATKVKDERIKRGLTGAAAVAEKVPTYVAEAEKFIHYSGKEKKNYVKTRINQFCIQNKIKYNDAAVDLLIEQAVSLTKKVNARGSVSMKDQNDPPGDDGGTSEDGGDPGAVLP